MGSQDFSSKSKNGLNQREGDMAGLLPITPSAPSLFNSAGIPLGKLPLQILTLFPPTGYLGLNLSAVGLPITGAIKAATYGAGVFAGIYANRLYVSQVAQILSYILIFAPPWYIFDCIQILADSKFDINGFLLPVPVPAIPSGGGKEGKWTLTFPLLSLILAATSFTGLAFIKKYLPDDLMKSVGKYAGYATLGGGILFTAIGLISLIMQKPAAGTAVPGVPSAISPLAGISGLTSAIPGVSAITSVVPGLAPTPAAVPLAQSGGGSSLPPLSSFIHNVAKQEGGGETQAIPFIGTLALIILGGFSLSFLRSKQANTI
jgi:hypothetical protein